MIVNVVLADGGPLDPPMEDVTAVRVDHGVLILSSRGVEVAWLAPGVWLTAYAR